MQKFNQKPFNKYCYIFYKGKNDMRHKQNATYMFNFVFDAFTKFALFICITWKGVNMKYFSIKENEIFKVCSHKRTFP